MLRVSKRVNMAIKKIDGNYKNNYKKYTANNNGLIQKTSTVPLTFKPNVSLPLGYKYYAVSFGHERVDKGLERFYEFNKNKMPITVRRYVESIDDKSRMTPLNAQKRAFLALEKAKTIEDIKKSFPDEPLFKDLINPMQTKASVGLLASVRENNELLSLLDKDVLKSKENLTVYLVKKIFLEAKTYDEINKDLENDLDEDFKADFRFKNPASSYIQKGTIKALGIHPPMADYQNSLRYTRDGYSDMVGVHISEVQKAFWASLDDNERTVRAKKSVEKFENWWNSHTQDEMLDMIAKQDNVLDMLKDFKKEQNLQKNEMKTPSVSGDLQEKKDISSKHVKVGSSKLGRDELFIKWATNNLKIYEENLSEDQKDKLNLKRMQNAVSRWSGMTSEEKTEYISKMKSGSEPARFAMIDVWNQSKDLILDLSEFLKEKHISKPVDLLFSAQEFSDFQSQIMTEFWALHQEEAREMGLKIALSLQKIKTAMANGNFDNLKKEIMQDREKRIKEIKLLSSAVKTDTVDSQQSSDYMDDFIKAYSIKYGKLLKHLPREFLNDYFNYSKTNLPEDIVRLWTKSIVLGEESLTDEENSKLYKVRSMKGENLNRSNLAIAAAIADILYAATHRPEVYQLVPSEAKNALYMLDMGKDFSLYSCVDNNYFDVTVSKKKIDDARIASLYSFYKQDLTDKEVDDIISGYFWDSLKPNIPHIQTDLQKRLKLTEYNFDKFNYIPTKKIENKDTEAKIRAFVKDYGKSALIIFDDKKSFPMSVKKAFYKRFKQVWNSYYPNTDFPCWYENSDAFELEEKYKTTEFKYAKKYSFLPSSFVKDYFIEFKKEIRDSNFDVETFIKMGCEKNQNTDCSYIACVSKKERPLDAKLKLLSMEEALADVLFDCTNNKNVYELQLEELVDMLGQVSEMKMFPSELLYNDFGEANSHDFSIKASKKPPLHKIPLLYKQYLDEALAVKDEIGEDAEAEILNEMLYVLNPDETDEEKDTLIKKRLCNYKENKSKYTI